MCRETCVYCHKDHTSWNDFLISSSFNENNPDNMLRKYHKYYIQYTKYYHILLVNLTSTTAVQYTLTSNCTTNNTMQRVSGLKLSAKHKLIVWRKEYKITGGNGTDNLL